jgi:hypothetical protein
VKSPMDLMDMAFQDPAAGAAVCSGRRELSLRWRGTATLLARISPFMRSRAAGRRPGPGDDAAVGAGSPPVHGDM